MKNVTLIPQEIFVPIHPYLNIEEKRIFFRACYRHSDETATLRKIVAEYEHIRIWMV